MKSFPLKFAGLIAVLGTMTSGLRAQATQTLEARMELRQGVFFEGEPIYVSVTVRNGTSIPSRIPEKTGLLRMADISVRDAQGTDMRRLMTEVLGAGPGEMQTLEPGASVQWVVPLHWYWGSYQEESEPWDYWIFSPGRYQISISFPSVPAISAISQDLVVRQRTANETRARTAFLAGTQRAFADVRRTRAAESAVRTIKELDSDPLFAPFSTLLLADFAAVLRGETHPRRSARFNAAMDSLRLGRVHRANGAEKVRLLQIIEPNRLDTLVAARPDLSLIPVVEERLRELRRNRRPQ